jgi:hypothetical protein
MADPDAAAQAAAPPDSDDQRAPQQRKQFAEFLNVQRRGALHVELTEQLAEVVRAVRAHGRGGSLALTITVKPGAKGTDTLVIGDDVKVKMPQAERPVSIAYADDGGNLHRTDPKQPELPLRKVDVGPGTAELRKAGEQA